MKVEVREGVLIVSLSGNLLTEQNNTSVTDLIAKNIESGTTKVLFNLSEVDYMNSSGLALLLSALAKTRKMGGELVLCSVPEQTKKLLQMTPLTSIFMVFAQEATAISFLKS